MTLLSVAAILVSVSVGATFAAAGVALAADHWSFILRLMVFPLLGLPGIASINVCLLMLSGDPGYTVILSFGLPWLQWRLQLDCLAGFPWAYN